MLKTIVLEHIALADRHLGEAGARIEQLQALVEGLEGQEKTKAEGVLATFRAIREQMLVHRDQLDQQLLLSEPPADP